MLMVHKGLCNVALSNKLLLLFDCCLLSRLKSLTVFHFLYRFRIRVRNCGSANIKMSASIAIMPLKRRKVKILRDFFFGATNDSTQEKIRKNTKIKLRRMGTKNWDFTNTFQKDLRFNSFPGWLTLSG